MNDDVTPSFSFSRKWSQRLNVLVGVLSLLAIVGMLNYVASRHFDRFHIHGDARGRVALARAGRASRSVRGAAQHDMRRKIPRWFISACGGFLLFRQHRIELIWP